MMLTYNTSYKTESEKEIWMVKNSSTLKVDGKTNINAFTCFVPSYEKYNDVLVCHKSQNLPCKVQGQLTIPLESFDCKHRVMTRDLQKTLKSHIYPEMYIDFKSFSALPSHLSLGATFTGNADITLAGKIRNYVIQFSYKKTNSDNIELIGRRTILFSEFGLTPPSKLGGAIKVKNELEVEFRLHLKRIE